MLIHTAPKLQNLDSGFKLSDSLNFCIVSHCEHLLLETLLTETGEKRVHISLRREKCAERAAIQTTETSPSDFAAN